MLKTGATAPNYVDLLGIPFVRGGRSPSGYDCYGLAMEMFRRKGVNLPDFQCPGSLEKVADIIEDESGRWAKAPAGAIGSLITIRVEGLASHVGVVVGRDRFIHSIDPIGVTTDRMTNGLFHILGHYDYV